MEEVGVAGLFRLTNMSVNGEGILSSFILSSFGSFKCDSLIEER